MKRLSLIFIALSIYLLFPNISHTADIIITVAGTGTSGYSGNNGPAIEAQTSPTGVSANSSGDLFIAEFSNNCIRKVDKTTGIITTVAGICGATGGYSGDGSAATSAYLNGPYSVFVNNSDIFIADFNNNCVRKVSGGIISTVAGNGTGGYSGDGGLATSAQLNGPYSVFVNGVGDIFIADYFNSRIRKVNASDGKISTFAGTGTAGYSGDGDLAALAQINQARGVFGDSSGNIYIADTFNHRIRKVDPAGYIDSIVNFTGTQGYSGDGGLASIAKLNTPEIVFVDPSGNIFITELGNHTIRKVDLSGYISTVAGNGTAGFLGECGIPTSAQLNNPSSVFVNSFGVFIADTLNYRIRKVTPPIPPKITTASVTGVTATTANSGGNIVCDGGSSIIEKGVCFSTSPNPTTSNSKLINGSPSPNFSSSVTGLLLNTTYYIRAYATNGIGTAYGNEFSFTTPAPPIINTISPTSGPIAGGTTVTIDGTNFIDGATTVAFGGTAAAITSVTPTQIVCTSPAHPADTVVITVTVNTMSVSSSPPSGGFTYYYTVNFTASPTNGGTINLSSQIVNKGAQTLPVSAVPMAGYTFLYWKDQSNAIVSNDPMLPAQPVTADTTYTAYFAAAAPQITGVSPASGLANTATNLIITGTDFTTTNAQAWLSSSSATPASTTGLTQITISSSSATQIIGTTPANLAVGTYYVFVYDSANSIWSTAANSMSNVFTINSVGNIYTWTGNYDQDWFNESNWLLGGSPAPTGYRPIQPEDTAIIPQVTSNRYPVLQNSVILNKFTMTLGTSLTIRNTGILQVNDSADVKGVITLEDYGNIQVPPSGTFSINTGGVLRLNGGGVQIHPSGSLYRFRNFGTIEWENGKISPMYEPGNSPCNFNNEGTIAITEASAYLINCNFINSKNFAINNGFLTVSDGSFTNAGTGLIEVSFNSTISFSTSSTDTLLTNKGTLKGRGTIGGTGFTFVNEGIVDPGWYEASVLYFDPLDIRGNYIQTSVGKLHIDANSSGNDFVLISGATQLNGTLEFAPFGTFTPVGSFNVLKSDGSMNGTLTLTPLSGYTIFGRIVPSTPNMYRLTVGLPVYVWTGTANDNWNDTANWESGAIPSLLTHSVRIPANCPYYPHINSDVDIGGISIEQNASLTIHSGFSFNIHGDSTNNGTITLLGGNVILADNAVFTNTGDLIFFTPSGSTSKIADAPASQGKLINTGMIVNQSFSGVLDVYNFEQIPTDSAKGISILSGDLRFASGDTQSNTYTIGKSYIGGSGELIFGSDNPDTYPMIILKYHLNIAVYLRWVSGVVEKASDVTASVSMILSKNAGIGSAVFKKLYGMDLSIAGGSVVTLKDGEFYLGNKANFKIDGGTLSVEGKMSFYNYDADATLTGMVVNNGTIRGTGILSFTPNPNDPKPEVVFANNSTISPGLSPGKLTIQGDYVHGSGILAIDLNIPTPGMYDELAVIGYAALDGTLTANFPSGFTPTQDSDFKILTATGLLDGTFASVNLPIIPGFHWEPVNYVSNSSTGSYAELKLRKDTSLNALDVVVYPANSGSVSGANGLIDCGTVCSLNTYPVNTPSLTLNASANSAYEFDHWELNGVVQTDTQPSITVSTSISNIVKAIFRLKTTTRTLSVSVSPSGAGSVSVYALGQRGSDSMCPPNCSFTVPADTQVSLYAIPNSGNTFLYWSGAAGGSSASTEITMNADKSVTAYFGVYVPPYEPPYYPPDTPDNPDEPDTPDNPDEPDTPDNPDEPDTPDNPDEPDTPDNPDEPPYQPPVITYDPPEPPAIVSPAYQNIIPQPPVKLIGTPFKGSGDQTHIFTHWLTHRADMFYRPGTNKDALFNDYIGSYSSGTLTSYSFADAVPGMKYVWKTGYLGSGNPNIAWSGESSFIVGIPEQSQPIDILPGETSAQYRMFSIPYWLQNEDAVAALGAIIGNYDTKMFRIGGYDANTGGFVEYGQGLKIVPGKAYWILSRNGIRLTVTGVPVNSDQTIGIVLDKGWNMIAPPNNANYDWTLLDIVVYDDNGKMIYQGSVSNEASAKYIDADMWLWAGSENDYVPTTVLEKGKGCWIKAKYPGVVLNFPVQARINTASAHSVRRSSSYEKPPMPMGNTGFSINSDNIDAGGGCFIDSAAN